MQLMVAMKIPNKKCRTHRETIWNGFLFKKRKNSSMKHNHVSISLFFLVIGTPFSICGADIDTLIIDCRTDKAGPNSVKTIDLSGKNIDDKKYENIFSHALFLVEAKIQQHIMINPSPVNALYLKKLDLSHGTLQQFLICKHLVSMPSLSNLDLSHNELTLINALEENQKSETENLFKHLEIVNVSHNRLKKLDFNLLNQLNGLKEIDYSHNPLNEIADIPAQPKMSCCLRFRERIMTRVILSSHEESDVNEAFLARYTEDVSPSYKKWVNEGRALGLWTMYFSGGAGSGVLAWVLYGASIFPVPYSGSANALGKLVGVSFASCVAGAFTFGSIGALIGHLGAQCIYKSEKKTKIFDFAFKDAKPSLSSDDEIITVYDSDPAQDGSDQDSNEKRRHA